MRRRFFAVQRLLLFCFFYFASSAAQNAAAQSSQDVFLDARSLEAWRKEKTISYLMDKKIIFEERELLTNSGSFGTNLRIPLIENEIEKKTRFILAVPFVSVFEAEKLSEKEGDDFPQNNLPFSFQCAFDFIENILSGGNRTFFEKTGASVEVFFLADEWTAFRVADEAGYAAWEDMFDGEDETCVVYLDARQAPKAAGVFLGSSRARADFSYAKSFSAAAKKSAFPLKKSKKFVFSRDASFNDVCGENTVLFLTGGGAPFFKFNAQTLSAAAFADVLKEYAVSVIQLLNERSIDEKNLSAPPPEPSNAQTSAKSNGEKNYAVFSFYGSLFFIREKKAVPAALIFTSAAFFLLFVLREKRNKFFFTTLTVFLFNLLLFILFAPPAMENAEESEGVKKAALRNRTFLRGEAPPQAPEENSGSLDERISVKMETRPFLDRVLVTLDVNCVREIERARLFFYTDKFLPFIYESPCPTRAGDKGTEFILGNYPPRAFKLELALPLWAQGEIRLESVWADGEVNVFASSL
ncbi:MAG: hypothetical protein LBC53_08445 [Spirochaetaceae bacterium]|jgi:hypothetical protein|nr:hypothetical protein [Spirochaetaceae bacterium]